VAGTGSGGTYTLSANYVTEATSTETIFSGAVMPGGQQNLSFDFSSTSALPAMPIKADITINTAIGDVSAIYNQGLLTDKIAKQKLIAKYTALKLKVTLADAAIKLAESARTALINNVRLSSSAKAKLVAVLDNQIAKLQAEREKIILESLSDITDYAASLKTSGVLKPLGYDIIKANNDYLINNW
jgi:hypothetical protein